MEYQSDDLRKACLPFVVTCLRSGEFKSLTGGDLCSEPKLYASFEVFTWVS